MNIFSLRASVSVLVALLGSTAFAVNIETVPVGNPGNAGDTRYSPSPGYGAVGYTYNIGKHEVTAGQYTDFLNAVAGVDSYELYNTNMWSDFFGCKIERYDGSGTPGDPYQYRVAGDWANRPVNFVSWGDSARFANWLHNNQPEGPQGAGTTETGAYTLNGAMTGAELMTITRQVDWKWAITSEDEWYKAAYHKNDGVTGNYWDFPTSSDGMPSNVLGIPTDPGNNATYYSDGYTIDDPYWRTEVGAHENSDSSYGTFDQGGNVWEWTEAVIDYSFRGIRGGSFDSIDSRLQASYRTIYYPIHEHDGIGFRVSEVPEPASIVMLALAGVGMLRRKRA